MDDANKLNEESEIGRADRPDVDPVARLNDWIQEVEHTLSNSRLKSISWVLCASTLQSTLRRITDYHNGQNILASFSHRALNTFKSAYAQNIFLANFSHI